MSHERQNDSWLLFPVLIVLIIVDTGSLVLPWQCNEQLSESKELCEPLPNHAGSSKLVAKPF